MKPTLGVCYYPEQWPASLWQSDAERMVALGITWVRIGEFSWSKLEPKKGHFAWEWLDNAIDILGKAGLNVVLGTPTATPPRWMLKEYPDMLAVDENQQIRKFGSRRHYDFSHLPYRQAAAHICEIIAERYAKNQYVNFWQIDNEYSCHDTTISFSSAALKGFRLWLENKYKTIEQLNDAWGNVFWSMDYEFFDDIELPNQTVTEANPAHWHDFRRYSSDQVVGFNKAQVDAIRRYDQSTPLLHNYMGGITDFDHFDVGKDLDAASWDSYPLGFLEDRVKGDGAHKLKYMRQGDPDYQAFHHDLYRAVGKGRWWVMEQQPGPVNWAPYNPAPLEGMVRLWSWEAIAHGAEVVSYFRWRQAPYAQEQMHSGLNRPDNQPSPAFQEVNQLAEELNTIDFDTRSHSSDVAIIFDYESAWAWETQPQGKDFSYLNLVLNQYRALRKLGLSIDICSPDTKDFSVYKVLLVPGLMHWKKGLKNAIDMYEGVVLIGPRTGSKTENFSIPQAMAPDCNELINIKIDYVESLRPDVNILLEKEGHVKNWFEHIEENQSLNVVISTKNQEAVLCQNKNIFYLAANLDELGLKKIIRSVCKHAELKTIELEDGLRIRNYGQYLVFTNYSNTSISLEQLESIAILEHKEIAPAGVIIAKKRH